MSKTERLYQLERPPFTSRDFHARFTHLAGPLSLFEPEDNTDVGNENPEVERPLTPIEDAVKCPPSSFSALAKILRPRLSPKDGIHGLTSNDQQQLIEILMNELNNIWRDVQRGPPDPFLTGQQNRELQRRLTIEIVVITQGLFAKYLDKANKLNQRGVFSGPANLSRLKTQLALEASKTLNVLSIKRNLAADMKHPLDTSTVSSKFSFSRALRTPPPKHYRPLVMRQDEDKKNKVHLSREEKRQLLIDRELSDLQKKMPQVDYSSYHTIVPHHLQVPKKSASDSGSVVEDDLSQQRNTRNLWRWIAVTPITTMLNRARRNCTVRNGDEGIFRSIQQKYASLPELFSRDAVFEELGILPEEMQDYIMRRSQSETKLMEEKKFQERDVERTSVTKPGTADRASQDLMKLLSPSKPKERLQGEEDLDDLPPLLQALARHSSTNKPRDIRKQRRLQTEAGSKDEEDDAASVTSSIRSTEASSVANDPTVMDENITEFTGEEHPQPTVVSLRLPDKTVVRASDVRVSNRVNKESVTLKRYPTVYNDLTGEIDAPMVKWLDRNLFIGEEIKEVYEEIIKTIGTDHLLFDQDTYVERHASTAEVSLCTSSSSLDKPRAERLINKHLKKEIPPPWGNSTADNWRNSPKFGGLGREDILQAKLKKGDDNGHGNKSYNSWLAWWRSTITTDDFLKFLSTQENDYMSLLFHLYDSDNEDDGEGDGNEDRPDTLQMALIRERERKRAELKSLKSEYKPGVWNVNSVLLGGLGNEPDVNDEELMANLEDTYLPVPSTVTPSKQPTVMVGSPLVRSASSVQSLGSNTTGNSDQHKLEATLRVNSVGFMTQASTTARGESASTSEAGSLSPQERLERIWMLLCMPDAQRLDMAIKYSAEPYSTRLIESLASWEVATEVILERESLMTKLEDFERAASDPNRFFVKGAIGSSAERIRESKTRDSFNKRLSQIDSNVRRAVTDVQSQFGDIVTFQGRPYLEKMSLDRTEMFYWLQQERRQQVMDKELVKMREVTLNSPDLPPIPAHTIL